MGIAGRFFRAALRVALVAAVISLGGCSDPQIYGSVGVSSGYGHGGYYGSPRMHTSISIGGRIR
jgi:hypothetical protein